MKRRIRRRPRRPRRVPRIPTARAPRPRNSGRRLRRATGQRRRRRRMPRVRRWKSRRARTHRGKTSSRRSISTPIAGPASIAMADAAANSSTDEATDAAIAAIATEAQPNPETDDGAHDEAAAPGGEDLGEVFGRVLALSQTINHPAFQRATEGFAENGRVYLVYADEELKALAPRWRENDRDGSDRGRDPGLPGDFVCASPGAAAQRHLSGIGRGCPRRPAQADGPRLRQQRQRASGRADFQRRLHRAGDLSRQKGGQARGYFFGRRDPLHVAHRRKDSERELARRGGSGAVLSAARGYARGWRMRSAARSLSVPPTAGRPSTRSRPS